MRERLYSAVFPKRFKLAVILFVMGGATWSIGCSSYENTVIQDTSKTKNKRLARIDALKGLKPNLKKTEPKPAR